MGCVRAVLNTLIFNTQISPPPPFSPEVRAIYDYNAGAPEELSFREGDEIILISSTDPDWWDGEKSGVKGVFPATYVERI